MQTDNTKMQTDNTKMQTDNTKMQTDIKENDNEQNTSCIIATSLEKEDFKFAIDLDDSNSDTDGDELDALNESFKLVCGFDNEDEYKEELEELEKYTNYTCIMCSNILKVRTSFCNASCEQNYLKNEK
jgi:hypothetical protein